jgi:hypothetical protein
MDFQSTPLHIVYSFQYFELIQYVNGLFKFLPTFQVNDSKITIDLDDFASFLKLMVQQSPIQLSQLTTCFYWNENFDYALMDILKDNWKILKHTNPSNLKLNCNEKKRA